MPLSGPANLTGLFKLWLQGRNPAECRSLCRHMAAQAPESAGCEGILTGTMEGGCSGAVEGLGIMPLAKCGKGVAPT